MRAEPALLDFDAVGDQHSFIALGTFADGTTLVITHSSKIMFVSNNPKVATVSVEGIATAVSPGETQILVKTISASGEKPAPVFSIRVQVPKAGANDSSTARP